jgi:DNA-binding beta-propeller fold protein YncE
MKLKYSVKNTRYYILFIPLIFFFVKEGFGQNETKHYLYVAEPGIRNYLEYGGHGVLVYDIDQNYKLIKRIPTGSLDDKGHPSNVKGVCVSLATQCIYVSTVKSLMCISLQTEKLVWEKILPNGFDRMSISPDGLTIFQPSFEKEQWYVIDAKTGNVKSEILVNSKAHNTIFGANGKEVYLEGLASPNLTIVNPKSTNKRRTVGPFSAAIRPFTVNGKQSLVYANVNGLLGFEIGDLKTGKVLHQIKVPGFEMGYIKRHGCPSHGIGLTSDEKELWVADGANQRMHIFDNTQMPPVYNMSVELRDQPGWVTFSLDGKYAWPSTGEIIELATKKIIKTLSDENGGIVQSEKIIEIHFQNGKVIAKGDQFGIGAVK